MQMEDVVTGIYGELHELLGDHREFKREVLARLSALESEVKAAPGARTARLCALVSALSGAVSILGGIGVRLGATVCRAGGAS